MQKSLFVELNNTKLISCPKCNKEVEVDMEENQIFCEECGEIIEMENNVFSEDFVWHPSERY